MTTEQWRKIEEMYHEAADLGVSDRRAFLDSACASDRELRSAVEGLLAADENLDQSIEAAIREEVDELAAEVSELVVGKRIGQYRVTGVIGAGGMGTIYRAVRDDDQYQKEVAIKVVKRGMDLDVVLRRFRRERQILARLEHPNIARLIDGGATENGQPYFVMEYVEGRPLTGYCADLPLKDRLRIFREVCAAVQYAHQNLIVHRDVKPANILVTREGVPKLLDFGLAKILSPDELPEQTLTMRRILTPDYASPEQVRGEAITTATDIYSLGAILYELVSGRHAHQFKDRTTAEMDRVICQSDPPPLEGELGSIAHKALHKEPKRRYATVEQLSEDVRRYLEGLPVLARKDTVLYRVRKFLRRNRWGSLAAAISILSLVIGTAVATVQSRRSERRFQEARRFANVVLGEVALRLQKTPGTLAIQQKLIPAMLEYLDAMAKDAGPDRAVLVDLARAYYRASNVQYTLHLPNLQEHGAALESSRKAWKILEPLAAVEPSDLEIQAHMRMVGGHIAWCLGGLGRHAEALQWLERIQPLGQVVGTRATDLGYPPNMAAAQWTSLAMGLIDVGRLREALAILDAVIRKESSIRKGVPNIPARSHRGVALAGIGDLNQADSLRKDLIKMDTLSADWRESYLTRLASLEGNPLTLNLGRRGAALRHVREAIKQTELRLSRENQPDNPSAKVLSVFELATLGALLRDTAPEQAIETYSRAMPIQEALLARSLDNLDFKRRLAHVHAEMALPLRTLHRFDEATLHLSKAVEIERGLGEPQPFTHLEWGDLLLAKRDRIGARQHYETALRLAEKAIVAKPEPMELRRELADCYERLGAFHHSAREWTRAREWYAKSLEIWTNWTKWGVSSIYDQARRKQAAQLVARYRKLHGVS